MKKTRAQLDIKMINQAENHLDKVVLDLMKMAKDDNDALSIASHEILEKARSMRADFRIIKHSITQTLQDKPTFHWAIERHGRWLGCSYGARDADSCGKLTHDLVIRSYDGTAHSGRCSNPINTEVQYDLQLWARRHDCMDAFTRERREIGYNNWEILKIPNY